MIRGSSITEKKAWPGVVDWYWRRRFAWLFGSLLVTVGIYPSIQVLGFASTPIRVALASPRNASALEYQLCTAYTARWEK